MLTRHFYELDEVAAALLWCIRNQRVEETAFWAQELIDSEMIESLYTTLYYACIWLFGVRKISCLVDLYELFHKEGELSDDEIVAYAVGLAKLSSSWKDASIVSLLIFGSYDTVQPDFIGSNKHVSGSGALEKAFLHACWQGKARLAWDVSRSLWFADVEKVYELLKTVALEKHKDLRLQKALEILQEDECGIPWATRCCAVALICLPDLKESLNLEHPAFPDYILEKRETWKSLEGRRARRVFAIPTDCLYWITQRGLGSNKKQNQKRILCDSWKCVEGCSFWNRVLEEEKPWESDDQKENFYDTYFPDDIPDEWSKEERNKSHGYGSLIGEEIANFEKYARRWFRGLPSCSVWMGTTDALALLSKIPNLDSGWDELYETQGLVSAMERWDLGCKELRKFLVI